MRKIFIVVLLTAIMTVPALASVQNIKVSGDFASTWVLRNNFDFGATEPNSRQNDILSFARVSVNADLTDNISTTVRLINERPWGDTWSAANNNQEIDLDLAYVELREMIYSPLTVTLGRQDIYYGNGFIMGGGPNNTAEGRIDTVAKDLTIKASIDAVKFVFNYDPLTIDIFGAVIDNTTTGFQIQDKSDDVNVYGINANYKFSDQWQTVAEGYFFFKSDRSLSATSDRKLEKIYVPGFRVSTNPLKGLNVQGELAWQGGTSTWLTGTGSTKREALGAQFIASYILPFEKTAQYEPVISYAYTYVSGDKNLQSDGSTGDRAKAWDPMFEDMAGGKIYNAIFDLTNLHINEFSFSASPAKELIAKLTWTILNLDKKLTSTSWDRTLPDDSTATYAVKTDKKGLGSEIDLDLTYAYSEDVEIGLSAGWFMPGSLFTEANEKPATQLLTSISVAF